MRELEGVVSWEVILKGRKKTATEFTVTERGYIKDKMVDSHDVEETWSTVRDQYGSIRSSLRDKKRKRKANKSKYKQKYNKKYTNRNKDLQAYM